MPSSKNLSSIFRSAVEAAAKASPVSPLSSTAGGAALQRLVPPASAPQPSSSPRDAFLGPKPSTRRFPSKTRKSSPNRKSNESSASAPRSNAPQSSYSSAEPSGDVSCVSTNVAEEDDTLKPINSILNIPWFESMLVSLNNTTIRKKNVSRERKEQWIFKNTQDRRFDRLVKLCARKFGAEATLQVFGQLGRKTGVKEYKALIGCCIDKARSSDDEEVALEEISKAFRIFEAMKEQGFQIGEETYGPCLNFLIDMRMVEEFHFFVWLIKEHNQSLASRFAYYEMLLYVRINDEEKIQDLCERAMCDVEDGKYDLLGECIHALCESDRKEFLQLLETVDIRKISSVKCLSRVFNSLGRLQMDSLAKKFLQELKDCDDAMDKISNFIFNFSVGERNLAVEDMISKYKTLHNKMEVKPSSSSCQNLVKYCCTSLQVCAALDLVKEICESGLTLSKEVIHSLVQACDESYEFHLVHRIHAMILHYNLETSADTIRLMIDLAVKIKDFDAAYNMLEGLEKMKLLATSGMYNLIMAGFFREKNIERGLKVLEEMELAGVKPDSPTFSQLIGICNTEVDIIKYREKLDLARVPATKHVYMALINAYAACGEFDKAKKVIQEKGIPFNIMNEIKGALVSALAKHDQMSDALYLYEEIKRNGSNLESKSLVNLIEHFQSDGVLDTLLQLLEDINDPDYWIDGCHKAILYCIREKHLSVAVGLLKRLKDRAGDNEFALEAALLEVFCLIAEADATYLQIGLDLLQTIKDDFGILPPRKVLDFLLTACANAKEADKCRLIWKEYQMAGLPYNVLSFLRMYQALLASGDHKSARELLKKIPRDDPHVCLLIRKCKAVYQAVSPSKKPEKKGKSSA